MNPRLNQMKRTLMTTLCCALAFAIAGCDNTDTAGNGSGTATKSGGGATGNSELAGEIEVDGSSTVYPITEAAAAAFKKQYGNVETTVGLSGTGGGFKRFTKGETDISDASRPIKKSEFDACKSAGVEFIELPVAYDGLTIVVNKDNDFVKQLTVDDLKKIFLDEDTAKTWQDVNAEWPAEEIKIFAPGTDSGTFDYFKEVVAGKEGSFRQDLSASEDDNVLVQGVSGNKYAIGFFGASYYFENEDKLNSVMIVNPEGKAVGPTATTIEDGSYAPFSRPLFIYVNTSSLDKAQVEKFVEFYLDNAADFAQQVGYVALPEAVYEAAKNHYLDQQVGTHYLKEDGEKRSGPVTEVYKAENLMK